MKLNRTNDFLFAKIFGDPKHKNIALSLVNAVFEFEGTDLLEDIEFIDRTLSPEYVGKKLSRLDILGRSTNGTRVNVEMQVVNEHNMQKRTLNYWAKLYSSLERGYDYEELTRTVTINIVDFEFLPSSSYHSMYSLLNSKDLKDQLTDDLEIHFVELPKWKAQETKIMKRLDRWAAYFTNRLSPEDMEEIAMQEPAIQEAMEIESIFTQDEVLRRQYEQREKAIMDYNSAMNAAQKIGLKIGLERGIQEGIEKGIQEGEEKGRLAAKRTLIKNILQKNQFSLQEIAELLDLPITFVEEIQKDL